MAARKRTPRRRERTLFAHDWIEEWLQKDRRSRGMYARKWGKSIIIGRKELAPNDEIVNDDRLKITDEGPWRYSLRGKDRNDKWMRIDQFGDLQALLDFIRQSLPHYLRAYQFNRAAEDRERTSGERH